MYPENEKIAIFAFDLHKEYHTIVEKLTKLQMELRSYMRLKICSNQKNTREDFKTFRPGPNMSDEIKNYSIMTIYKKITPLNNLIKVYNTTG